QRLDHASRRLIHPAARLAQQRDRAAMLARRLARTSRQALAAHQRDAASLLAEWRRRGRDTIVRPAARLESLAQNLAHLNPQAVLERGYAIVTAGPGAIVQSSMQIAPGDDVTLTLARGRAGATITTRED